MDIEVPVRQTLWAFQKNGFGLAGNNKGKVLDFY